MKMKWIVTTVFLLVLLLIPRPGFATSDITLDWGVAFGDDSWEFANAVSPTSDGGFLAAGVGTQPVYQEGYYVVKVDSTGTLVWERFFTLTNYAERVYSIEETKDGGVILIGGAYQPDTYNWAPWLVKLDGNGNLLWSTENDFTATLDVDTANVHGLEREDGSFILAGGSNTMTNPQQPWIALVSLEGALLDFTTYPELAPGFGAGTYIEDLANTPDGGFVLTGSTGSALGQGFLWKFDLNAEEEWVQLYQTDFFRVAHAVRVHPDGGYLLTGCELPNCDNPMLLQTDALGQTTWTQQYPDPNGEYATGRDLLIRRDGSFLVLQTRVDAIGATDHASDLLEIGADGTLLNILPLPGGDYATFLSEMERTWDGRGFAMAGFANESGNPSEIDLFILKASFPPDEMGGQPVSGGVALQGRDNHAGANITLWTGDQLVVSGTTQADGTFQITAPAGTYTLTVEMPGYLDVTYLNLVVTPEDGVTLPAFPLAAGDVDDSDKVNILDLAVIGSHYNLTCTDAGWDARADLNGDCEVNLLDLTLAASNFGKISQ